MLKAFERRRFAGGRGAAPMEVDAAVVLAADVSRSIDDGEFFLGRLATSSATNSNSNPASPGSGSCSRYDEAPQRTLLLVVDPRAVANRTDL